MTIINGIEIDIKQVKMDEIRQAIMNNDPVDDTLHVIAVTSNPCQFARRYILAREFVSRMEQESNVKLYIVELAYGNQRVLRHRQEESSSFTGTRFSASMA